MATHWAPSSTRSCVLRNGRSCQVRNAFSAFSTACWQWKVASPSSGGVAARSMSAPRRSSRARASHARVSAARIGSGGIEESPFARDGRGERGAQMQALAEGRLGPDEYVRPDWESPERVVRPGAPPE